MTRLICFASILLLLCVGSAVATERMVVFEYFTSTT